MLDKKILDVTCGSRTIWFNKHNPAAIYCDIRKEEQTGIWKSESGQPERTCIVDPDIQCDLQACHLQTAHFRWSYSILRI